LSVVFSRQSNTLLRLTWGDPMLPRRLLIILATLGGINHAHAHGIAGNRFFPGTLSFDDPAVADEAIVPNFAGFKRTVFLWHA